MTTAPTSVGSNAEGIAQLDAMIARLRGLPKQVTESAARDVAAFVQRELASTVGAGTSPTGEAWQPRKSDGGRPLANALAAIRVGVVNGNTVYIHLDGPEARHHRGWVRGGITRQIIPNALPPAWVPQIEAIIARNFEAAANGGGDGK